MPAPPGTRSSWAPGPWRKWMSPRRTATTSSSQRAARCSSPRTRSLQRPRSRTSPGTFPVRPSRGPCSIPTIPPPSMPSCPASSTDTSSGRRSAPRPGRTSPLPGLFLPHNTIAMDGSAIPSTIFVGTDLGVLRSVDNGANWAVLDDLHLPNVPVTDLVMHGPSGALRAATYGRGAFQLTFPDRPRHRCERGQRAELRQRVREHLEHDVAPGVQRGHDEPGDQQRPAARRFAGVQRARQSADSAGDPAGFRGGLHGPLHAEHPAGLRVGDHPHQQQRSGRAVLRPVGHGLGCHGAHRDQDRGHGCLRERVPRGLQGSRAHAAEQRVVRSRRSSTSPPTTRASRSRT